MFACLECGKKFRTARAAERAANEGCPECGGVDIDSDPAAPALPRWEMREAKAEKEQSS
ncbi:MAG TPA: hypothetical protein VH575_12870 [Gemmataceae bacterium]|jgi:predicted  nucleic acid-binding Zn-ribbon protein